MELSWQFWERNDATGNLVDWIFWSEFCFLRGSKGELFLGRLNQLSCQLISNQSLHAFLAIPFTLRNRLLWLSIWSLFAFFLCDASLGCQWTLLGSLDLSFDGLFGARRLSCFYLLLPQFKVNAFFENFVDCVDYFFIFFSSSSENLIQLVILLQNHDLREFIHTVVIELALGNLARLSVILYLLHEFGLLILDFDIVPNLTNEVTGCKLS